MAPACIQFRGFARLSTERAHLCQPAETQSPLEVQAFVVTLARAGEDNKSFRLTDLDQTFQSFVGADYDLQDAVGSAEEIKSASRDEAGQQFYDYVVEGSEAVYMASITVAYGKVFALFVSTPARQYKANEATMRAMIQSFRTI